MSATGTPFQVRPDLTAISIAFKNQRLIADKVLPKVPVNSRSFEYSVDDYGAQFTIPDSYVGRTSRTNDVFSNTTTSTGIIQDYALQRVVPVYDIETTDIDILGKATEQVSNLLALDYEKRVADIVFNSNNYAGTTGLSSTTCWDNAASDPIKAISDALDSLVMRPNVMVIGREAFSALSRNAKIVAAANRNSGAYGIAEVGFLQELFGLEEILIGESFVNGSKRGNTTSLSRCWGDSCALIYKDMLMDADYVTSFGFTAELGSREASLFFDYNQGRKGSYIVRVGESVQEVIASNKLGYLFTNCVA
jgi:hypothetical protein